jgi:hypothetical protein
MVNPCPEDDAAQDPQGMETQDAVATVWTLSGPMTQYLGTKSRRVATSEVTGQAKCLSSSWLRQGMRQSPARGWKYAKMLAAITSRPRLKAVANYQVTKTEGLPALNVAKHIGHDHIPVVIFHRNCVPDGETLRWCNVFVFNAKAFILGT